MIIQEKQTDIVPVTTEDNTGVNAALAIVLVFALIAVIGIYAYVVNNGSTPSTYIQRDTTTTNTVTPAPASPPTVVPVPTPVPVPSAPAPATPAPSTPAPDASAPADTSAPE